MLGRKKYPPPLIVTACVSAWGSERLSFLRPLKRKLHRCTAHRPLADHGSRTRF